MTNQHSTENQSIEISEWLNHSEISDLGPIIYGVQVWGTQTNEAFQKQLLTWYHKEKRDLPWRQDKTPYHIWISEIMLQQTQVDTVIPYYNRFLNLFPTIADLADANEGKLMKAWEGLGYYSRVRNMQVAANQIQTDFGGVFPNTYEDILSLKGIGPYTAGAIGSIAFDLPKPAIDGNAMRVFSRLFGISADIAKAKNRKIFEKIGEYVISKDYPGDFNQAIMDLGSSYESAKRPNPEGSPVKGFTLATLAGRTDEFPVKSQMKKAKPHYYDALIIQNTDGKVLIKKRTDEKLLNQLWTVPLIEEPKEVNASEAVKHMVAETKENYAIDPIVMKQPIGQVKHVFSHQIWHINVYLAYLKSTQNQPEEYLKNNNQAWIIPNRPNDYAYPTVQMKIWQVFQTYLNNQFDKDK